MANMLRADYYGWRNVAGLSGVTVRQKFGNHTLFFLDYNIDRNQRFLLPPEDVPFQIQMGEGPLGVRTFYGYVNHLEDKVSPQGERYTRLVGLGTSKVMNTASLSAWESQSRTGIVRSIAAKHRFRSVVHTHPEVLEVWNSGASSDFLAINALAEEMGYRAWIDGATVWMLDPQLVLASASSASTKIIRSGQQRGGRVFKGSNVPGQVRAAKRTVQYGLSRNNPEVLITTTGDRNLPVEVLTNPTSGYGEAQYNAEALARSRSDQSSIEETITGDVSITPGTPVRFDRDAMSPDQIGLWLVNEAVHEIGPGGFTTSIVASRDKDRPLLSRVPDVVRREGNLAKAIIRNGRTWEAYLQEGINV
jgi:phage protein D